MIPERSEGLLFYRTCKFQPCVTHSTRNWLRARQKSKRLRLFWANLRERMSKDIKTSQLKPGDVVWGRVLKELDLGLRHKVNGGFPYTGWSWTTNPSCVRARPCGAKSSRFWGFRVADFDLALMCARGSRYNVESYSGLICTGTVRFTQLTLRCSAYEYMANALSRAVKAGCTKETLPTSFIVHDHGNGTSGQAQNRRLGSSVHILPIWEEWRTPVFSISRIYAPHTFCLKLLKVIKMWSEMNARCVCR